MAEEGSSVQEHCPLRRWPPDDKNDNDKATQRLKPIEDRGSCYLRTQYAVTLTVRLDGHIEYAHSQPEFHLQSPPFHQSQISCPRGHHLDIFRTHSQDPACDIVIPPLSYQSRYSSAPGKQQGVQDCATMSQPQKDGLTFEGGLGRKQITENASMVPKFEPQFQPVSNSADARTCTPARRLFCSRRLCHKLRRCLWVTQKTHCICRAFPGLGLTSMCASMSLPSSFIHQLTGFIPTDSFARRTQRC